MEISSAKCEICVIRHRGICSSLTDEQLEKLNAIARRRVVPANQYIFRYGDEPISFASILSGVVKLVKTISGGEHIIGLMYAPEFLGHVFADRHRFSAAAATEVELCTYPRVGFSRFLLEFPELERWLFRFTVQELEVCHDWTLLLSRKESYERLAGLLLIMARRARIAGYARIADNCAQFELPLKRSELADYLGLTIETVSRNMGRLKRKGLIELRSGRVIVVPDIELLAAVANMDNCGGEPVEHAGLS